MRLLSTVAVFSFVTGLVLLTTGLAFRQHDDEDALQAQAFDYRPTAGQNPDGDAESPRSTTAITPVPTAPPFVGRIARIKIASIGVDHPIEEIGITNNQLDTPTDAVGSVGWYYIYDMPGHLGNSIFAAHKNYNFQDGPFAHLDDVLPGDRITVSMDGGPTYEYEVIFYERYHRSSIPMGDLIAAPKRPQGSEWITLITCGGRFLATQANGLGEYLERDVVIASRIDPE